MVWGRLAGISLSGNELLRGPGSNPSRVSGEEDRRKGAASTAWKIAGRGNKKRQPQGCRLSCPSWDRTRTLLIQSKERHRRRRTYQPGTNRQAHKRLGPCGLFSFNPAGRAAKSRTHSTDASALNSLT